MFRLATLLLLLAATSTTTHAQQDPTIDEAFIDTAIVVGEFSVLAANGPPAPPVADTTFYARSPAADGGVSYIVAKTTGDRTCYAAIAAPAATWWTMLWARIRALFLDQNFDFMDNVLGCSVQSYVFQQYQTIASTIVTDVRACVATCVADDGSDCDLVIGGHGGGGGVAVVLGIAVDDLNYQGITFGSVPAVAAPADDCGYLNPSRWHRFVNAIESYLRRDFGFPPGGLAYDFIPLTYDPVPMRTQYWPAQHFGYHLVMGYNYTIANLGLDDRTPLQLTYQPAHLMEWETTPVLVEDIGYPEAGYLDRLRVLKDFFAGQFTEFTLGIGYRDLCTLDAECGICHPSEPCPDGLQLACTKLCFVCPPRCNQ